MSKNFCRTVLLACFLSTVQGGFFGYEAVSDALSRLFPNFAVPNHASRTIKEGHSNESAKNHPEDVFDDASMLFEVEGITYSAVDQLVRKWEAHLEEWRENKSKVNPQLWDIVEGDLNTAREKRDKLRKILDQKTGQN